MWFVLVGFGEGWEVQSGPHPDKEAARMSMMKNPVPDGPDGPLCGIAYVEAVGRIETYFKWLKTEDNSCRS